LAFIVRNICTWRK